jgi:Mrp family chromosome partitioning ATPase
MSLMLNALKQIKARQSCPIVSVAAGLPDPAISPSSATVVESAEPQPQLSPAPPHVPLDDFMLPDSFSLEATIDQLQAFVSEAGLLDDSKSAADHETSDAAALADAGCDDTEPLVVMPIATDPHAATAQRILQQLPRGRSHALLFTSPSDGQGKTMTVARLAPRLAQGIEGELLVMDANFRNPDMARWLAAAPAWRLPDVLAGAVDWATAVQVTAHRRVSFLAGGTGVPSHGLSSNIQGARQLLRELASHYELVVIDSPSLAHRGTVQLAAVCDGVYLVVRLGDGSPRMLREAAQIINSAGGRLLGCVAIDAGM